MHLFFRAPHHHTHTHTHSQNIKFSFAPFVYSLCCCCCVNMYFYITTAYGACFVHIHGEHEKETERYAITHQSISMGCIRCVICVMAWLSGVWVYGMYITKLHGVGISIENSWLLIFFFCHRVLFCFVLFGLFLYTSKCMYRPVSWTTAVEENRIVESELYRKTFCKYTKKENL